MSQLTPAIRRRILADMGIDVWRLRAASVAEAVSDGDPVRPLERAPTSDLVRPLERAPTSDPVRPLERAPTSAPRRPSERAPAERAVPLTARSLALAGVVMLLEGAPGRRDLRLALDVLAAAADDWRAKPVIRDFDWPPRVDGDAVPTGPDGLRRALEAFVDKDLADHGASLFLCSEGLAGVLPERWPGRQRVTVPPLERLGRDAALKRALWQHLQRARRAAAPGAVG